MGIKFFSNIKVRSFDMANNGYINTRDRQAHLQRSIFDVISSEKLVYRKMLILNRSLSNVPQAAAASATHTGIMGMISRKGKKEKENRVISNFY